LTLKDQQWRMVIALDELSAHRRAMEMPNNSHPRLVGLRSFIRVSLVMLALSAAIWAVVYLLTFAVLR
jgi:hypothetical protein